MEIYALERDVMAATQSRLDMKRVADALYSTLDVSTSKGSVTRKEQKDDLKSTWTIIDNKNIQNSQNPLSISFAAGAFFSVLSLIVTKSLFLSAIAFLVVGLIANGNPLDEEGASGAVSRVIGRATLQSIEISKPKVQAVARAAISGSVEVDGLRNEVVTLQEENRELRLWITRRKAVDDMLSDYNLEELKFIAREQSMPVGGTKAQLLMRLVEASVIGVVEY